jgi:putative ABC transport system permease protein
VNFQSRNISPRAVLRLLKWFCPLHFYEEIEGDLIQKFHQDVKAFGEKRAKRRLIWNAIRFRPGIVLRNKFSIELNHAYMIQSHFKIAYRYLLKNKVFSLIHVSGLAVSMAAAFLILQYLSFELSYDGFHKNNDEIFRVTQERYENGELKDASAGTFYGVGEFIKSNFPEVKDMVRFYKWPANTGVLLMADNKIYNERNYFFAESDFFKVFSSLLVQGDRSSCLVDPNSVVISRRLALKMFGTDDVLGRTVSNLDRRQQEIIITGIMDDIPENSHFDLDVVRPLEKDWVPREEHFWQGSWWTYVTIEKNTSLSDFGIRLNEALMRDLKDNVHLKGVRTSLQPITSIHYSHLNGEIKTNGNRSVVYVIGAAFLIILIIAWINYINLETARFITRIKEVGV